MMKHTLTAAALAVVLAAPAFAQSPKPDTMKKPDAAQTHPITKSDTMAKPDSKTETMTKPSTSTQSSMSSSTADQAAFIQNQHATDWRGSKLIGATVYGPDNSSIGDINDVLIANDGKVNAVVIGVGGFLGVGEKNVAVPFEKLNVTRKPESASIDKITVSYSKDELKNAPKFAYFEPGKPTTTGSSVTDKIKSMNPMNDSKK
jgi:hypothetical protein